MFSGFGELSATLSRQRSAARDRWAAWRASRQSRFGRTERRVVWMIVVVLLAVTSLPTVVGLWMGHISQLEWKGMQIMSPGDMSYYLANIEQARRGAWLLADWFTTEPVARQFNLLWVAVGRLAALLGLTPLAAYHVARLLLIPPFVIVAHRFLARFLANPRERLVALVIFLFGSGFGAFFLVLFSRWADDLSQRPIDLWVSESNAFMSMSYSPHFVASWTLLLLSLMLIWDAFRFGDRRRAALAGLSALVLFLFHPFHVLTLYAVPAVWLLRQAVMRRLTRREVMAYLTFVGVSAPAVAYQFYVTQVAPFAKELSAINLCLSPNVTAYVIGFGLVGLLAPFGWYRARRATIAFDSWDFLAVWAITQFALLYFPVVFQRRLAEGLEFPLVVLATPALVAMLGWAKRHGLDRPILGWPPFVTFVGALVIVTTLMNLVRGVDAYVANQPPVFYFLPQETTALAWIREETPPEAVFLAKGNSSHYIVGWAGRRAYAGHWAGTLNAASKERAVDFFYSPDSATVRWRLARTLGVDYVWCGQIEQSEGVCPDDEPGLTPVYDKDGIVIYQVESASGDFALAR